MKIESLHIYPVKGLRGIDMKTSVLELRGLAHDRRWMLVDAQGKFMSQREQPRMALLNADIVPEGLRLSDGANAITVTTPGQQAERLAVTLWKQSIEGYLAAREVNDWLSQFLGQPCRLVYQGGLPRQVSRDYAPEDTHASYADGFPLLITNTASLDDLNRRMGKTIPMNRFRPSITVSGARPWAEDRWKKLRVANVTLDIVKPCLRCIVTTTDQQSGFRDGNEPLATLKAFRLLRQPGLTGVVFGQNAIPLKEGVLSVGDAVEVVETQTPPAFAA